MLVVTHAALVRAEDVRVLDAVAFEQAVLAVVHAHREVDDDLVLRLAQNAADVLRHLDDFCRVIEVALDDFEEFVAGRLKRRRGLSRAWRDRLHAGYCSSYGAGRQKVRLSHETNANVPRAAKPPPQPTRHISTRLARR